MSELEEFTRILRDTDEYLTSTVKIGWQEVLKLVVVDLIKKRKSLENVSDFKLTAFDTVLEYYLGEEDFKTYVIEGKEID